MTTTTAPCASITTGALRPDSRVNYTFGMVLGLDDFQQEQEHRLVAAALHQRGLHGYGVVSGLTVGVDSAGTITVSPGAGLDRWGRTFIVPTDQCADLGRWLDANVMMSPPEESPVVYVVGRYDQCLDDLRPLPAVPCTSSDTPQAPARIRDAWAIELTWDAPDASAWSAAQAYADLLRTVDVVPGTTDPAVLDQLRAALDDIPAGTALPVRRYQLGAADLRASLDALDRHWAGSVRPLLDPDPASFDPPGMGEPAGASILLGAIQITGQAPDSRSFTASDDNRPVLLHTQLIQELALLGLPRTPVESLLSVRAASGSTVEAWVHGVSLDLPASSPPTPPEGIQLLVDGVPVTLVSAEGVSDGAQGAAGTRITITATTGWSAGALLEVRLLLDAQLTSSQEPLRAVLEQNALGVLDEMADHVSGYAISSAESGRRVRNLFIPLDVTDDRLVLAVDGVHLVPDQPPGYLDLTVDDSAVEVAVLQVLSSASGSVIAIQAAQPWETRSQLRVSLSLDAAMTDAGTLRQALDATGVDFVGRTEDRCECVAAAQPRLAETLATVSVVPHPDASGSALSMWFHVLGNEVLNILPPVLRVLREGQSDVPCRVSQQDQLGRAWLLIPDQPFQPGDRLTVVLDLANEVALADRTLWQRVDETSRRPVDVDLRVLTAYAVVPPQSGGGGAPALPERDIAVVTAWTNKPGVPPLIRVWVTPDLDPQAGRMVEPENLRVFGVDKEGNLRDVTFQDQGWSTVGWNLFERRPFDTAWSQEPWTQLILGVPRSVAVQDLADGGSLVPIAAFAAKRGLTYRGLNGDLYQVALLVSGPFG